MKLTSAIVACAALFGLMARGPESTARAATGAEAGPQWRAIWVDNGAIYRLGGRAGAAALMDQIRQAGFNAVFIEALFRGYTLYPGPDQDPRFARWPEDPLQVLVEEARRRGLAAHAWVWALGAGIHGQPGAVLQRNPQWADQDKEGRRFSATDSAMPWLDPSRPEVRAFVAEQAEALARRYGIDGVHLDYVRYSNELAGPFGYAPHALEAFAGETGLSPPGVPAPSGAPTPSGRPTDPVADSPEARERWDLWREDQVTRLVAAVRGALARTGRPVLLSAAVAPELTQARLLFLQDWRHWLANGLVDFVVPMAYTSSSANLGDLLTSLQADLDALSPWRDPAELARRTVVGLALFAARGPQLAEAIDAVHRAGFGGVALFAASYLSLPARQALAGGPFAAPAPVPDLSRPGLSALPPVARQDRPRVVTAVLPVADPAAPGASTRNLARSARVTVDSSFRGYGPEPLTDGVRNDVSEVGRWAEVAWASAETKDPHWVQLEWPEPVTVSQVDIYWALDRGRFFSSRRVSLQALGPSGWQVLWEMESALPTHRISRTSVTFTPVTTTALRLVQPEGAGPLGRPDLMWVAEIEVY